MESALKMEKEGFDFINELHKTADEHQDFDVCCLATHRAIVSLVRPASTQCVSS